jgi:glutathione synthase/RimK-type ligase-like ATP-grasp enzyme
LPADGVRLAVLVPARGHDEPWAWAFDVEAAALTAAGASVEAIPWTEAGDLSVYDLVLPLVVWGYYQRYDEWLELLDRFDRERIAVINPPALLRWNGDKAYLAELGGKGVPTIPTLAVDHCDERALSDARDRFATGELVIKPPISASAHGTYRLGPGDALPASAAGRRMIIQPWIQSITREGEYSLMLFDGIFSHAAVKRPRPGDFRVQPHLGGVAEPCPPPPGSIGLAEAALAAAPARASYARVDMIADDEGVLRIMELELIEPALFLDLGAGADEAFARSIFAAADRLREQPLADR